MLVQASAAAGDSAVMRWPYNRSAALTIRPATVIGRASQLAPHPGEAVIALDAMSSGAVPGNFDKRELENLT
jgi:hypothetical protein